MMRWLFAHGWGFDQQCWQKWISKKKLIDHYTFIERGYFSKNVSMPDRQEQFDVIVAHSLGLHHVDPRHIFQCKMLVIISGFQTFHCEGKTSRVTVKTMLRNLKKNPHQVLDQFYSKQSLAYEKQLTLFTDRLYNDLTLLDKSILPLDPFSLIPEILIFHGSKDEIIPHEKSIQWYHQLPQSTNIMVVNGGHALPITHAEFCCDVIDNHKKFF